MAAIDLRPRATKVLEPWMIEGLAVEAFKATQKEAPDTFLQAYTLTLGDRPYVRSIRKLYKARKQELPPEIAALKGETYLLAHAVGLIAKSGAHKIDRITYQASFSDPGATIELFPNTRFKESSREHEVRSRGVSGRIRQAARPGGKAREGNHQYRRRRRVPSRHRGEYCGKLTVR